MAETDNALRQAMQLMQSGRLAEAEQAMVNILARNEQNTQARVALGITCYQMGKLDAAERHLSEAISAAPEFLPAYNNLALVHKAKGNPDRAMAILQRALEIHPSYVDALYNLAILQGDLGIRDSAIASYQRVIALKPDFSRAHTNLGLLLRVNNDFITAHGHLDLVAQQHPQDVSALVNLALVLADLARYADAIDAGNRAATLAPDNADVWEALGSAQRLAGDAHNAVHSLQRAHALNPESVDLQYELGLAQNAAGDIESARKTWSVVARQRPDWLKVLFTCDLSLPLIYLHDQHIADSNAGFAAGIANIETRLLGDQNWSTSEGVAAISGYAPFYLHYQGLDNTQLQRRFGRIVETIAARAWPQFAEPVGWRPMNHGGRLRIGFVSAYLRRHSVGHFFGAWLRQLDPQKFESFVWYTGEATDDVTESIHRRAAHFSHSTFDIAALAAAIRASRLDILIYLDVGMHPQSQVLAALRLAPIQCATFGHPVTTGIGSIGYYLSAAAAEPDNAEEHYHEQLIRLPRFAVSFARPDVAFGRPGSARVSDSSVQRRLRVLCPQPLFKILPHFDRLATRIVRELPGCKLLFFQSLWPKVNDAFVVRISAALRAAGIDPGETLEFLPILPHGAYLDTLASADVILDTPGFSGGNSSFDAIAVNAPIVTQRGAMLRGRQTAAMLDIVGLPEYSCVADDDYVQQAISVASSKARQMVLRDRMKSGGDALFSDAGAVPALENALIELAAHSTQG